MTVQDLIQQANPSGSGTQPSAPPLTVQDLINQAHAAPPAPSLPLANPQAANPIVGAFNSGVNEMGSARTQALNASQMLRQGRIFPAIGNMAEAGLHMGEGAITSTLGAFLAPATEPIANAVGAVADKISNVPAVQKFARSRAGGITARAASDIGAADTLAGVAVGGEPSGEALSEVPGNVAKSAVGYEVRSAAKDWSKPGKLNKPGFVKAKAILKDNPTIPTFLAEHGLNPSHLSMDGRFDTSEAGDQLRLQPGTMSRDMLRPSLQIADHSSPPTPISDVSVPESRIQAQGRGVTPDNVESIQNLISNKIGALQRKYPKGMTLTNMHDEGITYNQNGKFSIDGNNAIDNNAIANRSLGATLKGLVEKKAPAGIPVHEFNQYLSQFYKAADYLDALDNKTVPRGFFKKMAHNVAGGVGVLASNAFGGGVLMDVVGYQTGHILENALEHMSSPVRNMVLRNMEQTRPEAFHKIQQFLQQNSEKPPVLPPATSENPLPSGPANQTNP